jgi:hypothetical protein
MLVLTGISDLNELDPSTVVTSLELQMAVLQKETIRFLQGAVQFLIPDFGLSVFSSLHVHSTGASKQEERERWKDEQPPVASIEPSNR